MNEMSETNREVLRPAVSAMHGYTTSKLSRPAADHGITRHAGRGERERGEAVGEGGSILQPAMLSKPVCHIQTDTFQPGSTSVAGQKTKL